MSEQTVMRHLSPAAAVLLVALVFGVYQQGAYFAWQHRVFAGLVAAAGAALTVSADGRRQLATSLLVAAPLLAASAISLLVADEAGDAASTFVTMGLVAVAIAAGLSVRHDDHDLAIDVVLGVVAIVALTAIWGVATHTAPWGRITGGLWRGSSSLTYANAAAALLGPAVLISIWRADRTGSRSYGVYTTVSLIAFASTQSRGGALALLFGGIVLLRQLGLMRLVHASAPSVLGGTVGSVGLLSFASDARDPSPIVTLGLVAVGCALTAVLWHLRTRITRPTLVVGAGAVVVVGAAFTTPLGERLTLSAPTTATGADGSVLLGDRAQTWTTAWERFVESPIVGHGPGNVELQWTEGGRSFSSMFVHNEYLELLVTHGLIGAVALCAGVVLLWKLAPPSSGRSPAGIAIATFLTHSAFDYLWHVPALPVAIGFLLGLWAQPRRSRITTQ